MDKLTEIINLHDDKNENNSYDNLAMISNLHQTKIYTLKIVKDVIEEMNEKFRNKDLARENENKNLKNELSVANEKIKELENKVKNLEKYLTYRAQTGFIEWNRMNH